MHWRRRRSSNDSVSWAPHVAAGKMRLLMQFGEGRLKKFPDAPSLAELMRATGYRDVGFERMTFGVVALHIGKK